jgi:DNA-binding MarR family transcriptional regulator
LSADPVERLGDAFRGLIGAHRRLKGRETHRPDAVSHAQFSLLFALARKGELSARELACAADLSPATVTQMLDAMAATGLVTRVRSESDKRIVLTSLSERGRELTDVRRASYEAAWRAALEDFDDTQLDTAAAVLNRLREMLNRFAAEEPEAAERPVTRS